jgi:hypothetical protein
MAKKRRKDQAEEENTYEFRPPEFDEKEFLAKELRDTKTVLLTVGYAVLFGVLAAAITIMDADFVLIGLALAIAGLASLKVFYQAIKVNLKDFTKKNWAGNMAWFFFTFLATWVLLFNYPFSDHAEPDVNDVTVWIYNSDTQNLTAVDYKYVASEATWRWIPRWGTTTDGLLRATDAYTVNITATVSDNGNLKTIGIAIGSAPSGYVAMTDEGDQRYGHTVDGATLSAASDLMFYIEAVDEAGNALTFYPIAGFPVSV